MMVSLVHIYIYIIYIYMYIYIYLFMYIYIYRGQWPTQPDLGFLEALSATRAATMAEERLGQGILSDEDGR